MRLAIIETGHAPEALTAVHGSFPHLMETMLAAHLPADTTFPVYTVVDGVAPPAPDAADAFLVTGSRHGAYEPLAWIAPLMEAISAIHAARKPMVGICFGHQIIAQALGGKVEKFAGGWGLGPTDYVLTEAEMANPVLSAAAPKRAHVTLNAVHQDQVTALPPGAQVLAASSFTANAVLAIGETTLTIQPHPEFSCAYVADLMAARPGMGSDALRADAAARLEGDVDNTAVARAIAHFMTRHR